METIIIFTDWDSIFVNQNNYELSWVPKTFNLKPLNISKEKSILIVWDQIVNENIDELSGYIPKQSRVFILHHRQPNKNLLIELETKLQKNGCEVKPTKKQHDDVEYVMIQRIDLHGVKNPNLVELEKVFDELKGMLSGNTRIDIALEFLHKCLLNPVIDEEIDKLDLNQEDIEIVRKCTDNSFENLSAARDALLKTL
ncbi:MAG: hypothetical protein WC446_03485 [Candidatus Paceibacterota bacterium]|nr:hypothetical protein [Clostridia bacterium]MDD3092643.1 hypothetical protein [Clostridia bacterium]MDD3971227.1 hypothetical protein [Clostridia bacterium]